MIYYFLKPLINIYFKVFFKKIYFTGEENVPDNKSIVFAVNHPTAFLDPIAIASMLKPTLHFMLRGDIFNSPIVIWLLNQIKTIPIFRFRDGFSALKNNQQTFDLVNKKLLDGQNILILAEGLTKHEKKMRPIQKGAARMVFGAYEKYNEVDIVVIPVGVNYTNSDAFRSMIMVDIGSPIPLEKYFEIHAQNPRKAIKQLTDEISERMYERIVHINDIEDEEFVEGILQINRYNMHHPVLPAVDKKDSTLLKKEKMITEKINNMEDSQRSQLKERTLNYLSQLKNAGVTEIGLAHRQRYSIKNTLILLIGLLPFVMGVVFNFLPLAIGKMVANKKVTKIEFHSSVRFAVGMLLAIVQMIIFLIVAAIYWGWYGFFIALLIPIFGFFSLYYLDFYQSWKAAKAVASLEEEVLNKLQQERAALLNAVL